MPHAVKLDGDARTPKPRPSGAASAVPDWTERPPYNNRYKSRDALAVDYRHVGRDVLRGKDDVGRAIAPNDKIM
jgi:hypothetical protein